MDNKTYAKVVASNLRRLAATKGKRQVDIANEMNIPTASVAGWMNGTRTPKMETIDRFCEYFQCRREDIIYPFDPKETEILSALEKNIVRNYREADKQHKSIVLLALGLME